MMKTAKLEQDGEHGFLAQGRVDGNARDKTRGVTKARASPTILARYVHYTYVHDTGTRWHLPLNEKGIERGGP